MIPENAVLQEQKAQVLLEIGDSWNALKAATREAQFLFHFIFIFLIDMLRLWGIHNCKSLIMNDSTTFFLCQSLNWVLIYNSFWNFEMSYFLQFIWCSSLQFCLHSTLSLLKQVFFNHSFALWGSRTVYY